MPKRVLYAAQRYGGVNLMAALDYGDYVCHVEIGVDMLPRYDTYLQVYGERKVVQVRYDTPYVRNMPTRLIITEERDGRVTTSDSNPAWSDNFTLEWRAFYDNITRHQTPKSSPEDFRRDLELFTEMIQWMR
jgi:predicted dehydrogenase